MGHLLPEEDKSDWWLTRNDWNRSLFIIYECVCFLCEVSDNQKVLRGHHLWCVANIYSPSFGTETSPI
jgi:hypothetical protein